MSLKSFDWTNVGPASQTVTNHYITIGPRYHVIRVVAFRGIKRQCTRMAVRANTEQSPNYVSMLGQRQIRLNSIETATSCDAGPTLNRYWVGGPTLCVPGTTYRRYTDLSMNVTVRSVVKNTTSTTWMLASTGDCGGRNRPTRWRYTCLLGSFNKYILDIKVSAPRGKPIQLCTQNFRLIFCLKTQTD